MSENLRPKWAIEAAVSAAVSMHEEALSFQSDLAERIDAGLLARIIADAAELREDAAAAESSRADRKSATMTQAVALDVGATTVAAVRTAIRRAYPNDKALQREFGVGRSLTTHSVGSVVAGLRTILDAAAANPDRTRGAGIIPRDTEEAQAALDGLVVADRAQDQHKVAAKAATARRLATQLRLEANLGKLLAAVAVGFRNRPDVVARFESLIPARPHRSAKPPATGRQAGTTATTTTAAGPA
jgi:hypothetical protein